LNVILYGKSKGLLGTEELLKSIKSVENVSVFEHFPLAREYLEQHHEDMIILDADDDKVGWQYLAERFREIDIHVRIVLLSCCTNDAVRAYEAGIFDYLLKPVKKKQMERIVEKCEQFRSTEKERAVRQGCRTIY